MLNDIAHSVSLDPFGFPSVVVSGATASGTSGSFIFSIGSQANPKAKSVAFSGVATGSPSAVTAELDCSYDGGTTWQVYNTNSSVDVNGVTTLVSNLVPGIVYRLNLTVTGGTTPSVNVNAACA